MNRLKEKMRSILYTIRNPETDDAPFRRELSFKRLLILAPFIIAALIFLLMSLD